MFLEIRGIRKSFGEGDSLVEVLKGIDLSVEKGEFCVLLGPSGSSLSRYFLCITGCQFLFFPLYFSGHSLCGL